MISFFPEREDDHDIAIQTGNEVFLYRVTNTPVFYLDINRNKRFIFALKPDHRLYILNPTNNPLDEDVGVQPLGYPLIPK